MLANFDPATVAAAALVRPSDFGRFDARLYSTHAPVYSWAENSGDLLDESNHATILADLEGTASHQAYRTDIELRTIDEDSDESDDYESDVFNAFVRHWAVGPCSQIFVRVYEPVCVKCGVTVEPGEPTSNGGRVFVATSESVADDLSCGTGDEWHEAAFTATWLRACEILDALDGYPVFDESDHSEREWAAFETDLALALDSVAGDYPDDTEAESEAVRAAVYESIGNGDLDAHGSSYAEADYEAVAEIYSDERNRRFEALAAEHEAERRAALFVQCVGQTELGE